MLAIRKTPSLTSSIEIHVFILICQFPVIILCFGIVVRTLTDMLAFDIQVFYCKSCFWNWTYIKTKKASSGVWWNTWHLNMVNKSFHICSSYVSNCFYIWPDVVSVWQHKVYLYLYYKCLCYNLHLKHVNNLCTHVINIYDLLLDKNDTSVWGQYTINFLRMLQTGIG